jgi:TonB family protein
MREPSREAARPAPQPTDGPDPPLRIEGADLGADWIRQLQIWWDVHAFYPKEASEKNVSGIVKLHLWVRPDGRVWTVKVEQSSGSAAIDEAAHDAFLRAVLQPFPPGTPAPRADVYITARYILTQAGSAPPRRAFTITNAPVKETVVETMNERICPGTMKEGWPIDARIWPVEAMYYRKPDGTPWVRWTSRFGVVEHARVTENGTSARWNGLAEVVAGKPPPILFEVWRVGENHLAGRSRGYVGPPSTVDLFCK